uniref:Uncharacterized protein n=1 Tax=Rhizophora mucronata TaxID=61149 RepID=A0A2P2IUS3_RHIMU
MRAWISHVRDGLQNALMTLIRISVQIFL